MNIVPNDNLKVRLAKWGSSKIFGDFQKRQAMDSKKLVKLFDEVWEEKLKNAISQSTPSDAKLSYSKLTHREKLFFEFENQQHRRFEIDELEFIAQLKPLNEDDFELTQLWQSNSIISDETNTSLKEFWNKRPKTARGYSEAHYRTSSIFKRNHYLIGVPATALAIIAGFAGTETFTKLIDSFTRFFGEGNITTVNDTNSILVPIISLLVALLTGLQTYLNFNEQSQQHLAFGRQWAALSSDIEYLLISSDFEREKESFDLLHKRWVELEESAPRISNAIYNLFKQRFGF